MSYYSFRNISGMDNSIDRNEYSAYYNSTHPFSGSYSNYKNANDEFNLVDRNRNGRIEYHEYADAQSRKNGGYYPGSYTSGYSYYY